MPYRLFERFGVELEYMIVDGGRLTVLPVADTVLKAASGGEEYVTDVERGPVTWSNELALHVIELKTTDPAPSLNDLPARFTENIREINRLLAPIGGRLLPSGMHPFMDPHREMRLWPHEYSPVYETFDRIFSCKGHGWANLQSVHLNLPFDGDEEFGRLHAAIRLLLPILPALSASSPVMDGRITGVADNRLAVYRTNARKVPSVSGRVVPEPVFTRDDYENKLLAGIYRDLEPLDPEGVLRHEWVNARGAIARFTRGSIEIRVLDVQECPAADVAICAAITAVLRDLVGERWTTFADQQTWDTDRLQAILLAVIDRAGDAAIGDPDYLSALGFPGPASCTARDLWSHLVESSLSRLPGWERWRAPLGVILGEGSLAIRLLGRLRGDTRLGRLREVYTELADCLDTGTMFRAAG